MLPNCKRRLPTGDRRNTYRRTTTIALLFRCPFAVDADLVLVVLVIFVFLRSVRATIIPVSRCPSRLWGTSASCTCWLQPQQSLIDGADDSTGFVVDDAIVMIENISLYRQGRIPTGKPRSKAPSRSLYDSVFDRLADRRAHSFALQGDNCRRLFREFAVTLAVTIIVSAFVSLTSPR